MAISTFEELSDAVMQAESQGKRYDKKGRPLTSSKGAKGEMQVMDPTFKSPGFGVEPPRDKSLDERARVGRDYLKAMVDRYGDMPTALVAYNWGPGNADRWLKAGSDIGKLPSETKSYVTKILGGFSQPAPEPVAQPAAEPTLDTYYQPSNPMAARAAQQERMRKPAQSGLVKTSEARPDITSLGPSYQAALALAALSDTDEEDEAYKEKQDYNAAFKLQEEPTAKSQLASLDLKIKSPFQAEEPLTLSHGGVVHRADGSPETGEQTVGYPANIRFSSQGRQQRGPISQALESGEGLKEAGRGVVENVLPNWAGAPVDIATMLMRPFGYDVKAPVGGSESIKEFLNRAGVRKGEPEDKTLAGFYEAGNIGSGLVNPVGTTRAAVRAAGTAAEKTGQAAKMLEDMTVGNVQRARIRRAGEEARQTPESVYRPLRERMEERGNLMYITSPVGRVIPTTDTSQVPISTAEEAERARNTFGYTSKGLVTKGEENSALDSYVNDLFVNADSYVMGNPEIMGPVKHFLETKLVPWIKHTANTVSDPVREALITGKIKLPKGSDQEKQFPQALLNAAREGDPTAMYWVEKEYDKLLGIKGQRAPTEQEKTARSSDTASAAHRDMTVLILDQMKRTPEIMPDSLIARLMGKDVQKMKSEEVKALAQKVRQKIKDTEGGWFTDVLEPKLLENLIPPDEGLSGRLISVQEPKTPTKQSMLETPEGIAALQRHQPILHDVTSFKILGLKPSEVTDAITRIRPEELKNMGVSEFLTNVFKGKKEQEATLNAAVKTTKLAKQGAPVPIEVSGIGTKETLPRDAQGFQWREITSPDATQISAKVIDNSIGNYSRYGTYGAYGTGRRALEENKVRLFALFTPENHIVTNVEYDVPKNTIAQMYGNGVQTKNVTPENYLPQMSELIKHLKVKEFPYSVKNALKDNQLYVEPPFDQRKQDQYLNLVTPEGRKHGGFVERNTDDGRRYL